MTSHTGRHVGTVVSKPDVRERRPTGNTAGGLPIARRSLCQRISGRARPRRDARLQPTDRWADCEAERQHRTVGDRPSSAMACGFLKQAAAHYHLGQRRGAQKVSEFVGRGTLLPTHIVNGYSVNTNRLCSSHSAENPSRSTCTPSSAGCRPSKIASTISGASNVTIRIRPR